MKPGSKIIAVKLNGEDITKPLGKAIKQNFAIMGNQKTKNRYVGKPQVGKATTDNSNVIDEMTRQVESLIQLNHDLMSVVNDKQSLINEISVQLDSMTKERDEYKSRNSEAVKVMNQQQEEINKLTSDLSKSEKDFSGLKKGYDTFLKTSKTDKEIIQNQLDDKILRIDQLKYNYIEIEKVAEENKKQLVELKSKWYVKLFGGWG